MVHVFYFRQNCATQLITWGSALLFVSYVVVRIVFLTECFVASKLSTVQVLSP